MSILKLFTEVEVLLIYHQILITYLQGENHLKDLGSSRVTSAQPFNSQDLISNSPYCLTYSSCDVDLENLVLDRLIITYLIFCFILITCLLDIVLILFGEILSWSLMGVKGLR